MADTCTDRETGSLKLLTPAKVNLTLEVLGCRADGYHEVRSVIQAVSLCDELTIKESSADSFACDQPDWLAAESLVPRAVASFRETTGVGRGVSIRLNKRIPLLSGLGGDSSDGAAVLRGLNRLWGTGLSRWHLVEIAQGLGSDVPFFLTGGTALAEGRGEVVTPLPTAPHMWLVLLVPPVTPVKGKTAQLYSRLGSSLYTDGQATDKLVESLARGEVSPASFFNVLEGVAAEVFEDLERWRWQLLEAGAYRVHLAGSGPSLFTVMPDKSQAEKVYRALKQKGLPAELLETLCPLE